MTAKSLEAIGEIGGPRCCKRDSFLSILNAVDFKGKLVVSCQALPHEPLHSSYIMSRMAVAAMEGGAITRPQEITARFVSHIAKDSDEDSSLTHEKQIGHVNMKSKTNATIARIGSDDH